VTVTWSPQAPARIAEVLKDRRVAVLRIAPSLADQEADAEYRSEGPEFDEVDMPIPPALHEVDGLAGVDFGDLRALDLSYVRCGVPGARALAAATGRIEELDLRYCALGDPGVEALAHAPALRGLRRLHLQRNALTGAGARALARFERLEELDLRYNPIGEAGARALAQAPFAASLTRLLLHREDLSAAGVQELASAPRFPSALRSFWRSM